jgi:hypothetical protein
MLMVLNGEDHHPHFGLSGDQLLCGSSWTYRDRRYHFTNGLHMTLEGLPVHYMRDAFK